MDNSTELEFRDGRRVVPEYLATLMGSLDTTLYTYQQAVDRVNSGALNDHLGRVQQQTIDRHFEDQKGRRDGSG